MTKKKGQPTTRNKEGEQSFWNPGMVTITVALIGLVGTIITLLFQFPPFQKLFESQPTTTPEPTLIITATATTEPAYTETYTPVAIETFTLFPPTETATITLTPSSQLPIGMQVSLIANQTRGKIPLKVRLNTKDSFFRDPSGEIFPCGACNYTWQVRRGSNIIFGPQEGQATFEFTFRDRGTYFVTVVICRNQGGDCGSSGALIVAE